MKEEELSKKYVVRVSESTREKLSLLNRLQSKTLQKKLLNVIKNYLQKEGTRRVLLASLESSEEPSDELLDTVMEELLESVSEPIDESSKSVPSIKLLISGGRFHVPANPS